MSQTASRHLETGAAFLAFGRMRPRLSTPAFALGMWLLCRFAQRAWPAEITMATADLGVDADALPESLAQLEATGAFGVARAPGELITWRCNMAALHGGEPDQDRPQLFAEAAPVQQPPHATSSGARASSPLEQLFDPQRSAYAHWGRKPAKAEVLDSQVGATDAQKAIEASPEWQDCGRWVLSPESGLLPRFWAEPTRRRYLSVLAPPPLPGVHSLQAMEVGLLRMALELTVTSAKGDPSPNYTLAILERWQREGLVTLAAAQAKEEQHQAHGNGSASTPTARAIGRAQEAADYERERETLKQRIWNLLDAESRGEIDMTWRGEYDRLLIKEVKQERVAVVNAAAAYREQMLAEIAAGVEGPASQSDPGYRRMLKMELIEAERQRKLTANTTASA